LNRCSGEDVLVRGPICSVTGDRVSSNERKAPFLEPLDSGLGAEPKEWFWLARVVALQNPQRALNCDLLRSVRITVEPIKVPACSPNVGKTTFA